MQVAVGAGQIDLLVDEAAQRGRDHRGLGVPHAGVADQRQVELELLGVVLDETEQVLRAAFLLALDHHGDRQRQRAGDGLEGAAGLDEGHHLAFVVAGAARHDGLAAIRQRRDPRRERRRLPLVERIDRLHVVMAVKQHTWRLAVGVRRSVRLADHDRMAPGRPHAGVEADAAQVLGDELGGGLALVLVGHVGRDRLDAQEVEQPLDAAIEIGVDLVEHGRQGLGGRGHFGSTISCVSPAEQSRRAGIHVSTIIRGRNPARQISRQLFWRSTCFISNAPPERAPRAMRRGLPDVGGREMDGWRRAHARITETTAARSRRASRARSRGRSNCRSCRRSPCRYRPRPALRPDC